VRQSLKNPGHSSQSWSPPPKEPVLGTRDVHVWRVSLEQSPAIVEHLRQLLSADEQARGDRFHFDTDRRHFIVARGCLRIILSRYLKIAPAAIQFSYAAYGKPQLSTAIAEVELKFNLAHSGGLALYGLTLAGEIGVDLEHIRPEFTGDDIARRFFSATELAGLDRLPVKARHEAFFNCWTRKEAFIKAKGVGLSMPLDQFDVTLAPAEPAALLRTSWDKNEAARWSLQAIEVGDGFAAAVAVEAHDWQLSCWQIEADNLI
jgi:4'-phosphopantetheinyl transferase